MKEVERTWKKREEQGMNKRVGRSNFIEEVQISHNICKYVATSLLLTATHIKHCENSTAFCKSVYLDAGNRINFMQYVESCTDFVKRPSIIKATIPHLVDNLLSCFSIGTCRISCHRFYRTSSNTSLLENYELRPQMYQFLYSTWCCLEKEIKPRLNSRVYLQSPLKLFARISSRHSVLTRCTKHWLTSLQAWCLRLFQSILNLQWSYMCMSSWTRVCSICASLKKCPEHRMTAPGSGVNPPERVRSHGAQRTFNLGTSHPLSLRCFSMNTTAGPGKSRNQGKRWHRYETDCNSWDIPWSSHNDGSDAFGGLLTVPLQSHRFLSLT